MAESKKTRVNEFKSHLDPVEPSDEQAVQAQWQKQEKMVLGRRELLKALAATAGSGVLLNLPTDWNTPLVEVGALPAHAASSNLSISNLDVVLLPVGSVGQGDGLTLFFYLEHRHQQTQDFVHS